MAHGMQRFLKTKSNSAFKIQITSMVDMFVLLLIFLLMNYSTDKYIITANKNVTLPASNSDASSDSNKTISLVIGKTGIYVGEEKIIEFNNGTLPLSAVDERDSSYLPKLFETLDRQAEEVKKQNPEVTDQAFDGRVLVQADRSLPYDLIRKVMYTSMMAGFSDVRLAVVGK